MLWLNKLVTLGDFQRFISTNLTGQNLIDMILIVEFTALRRFMAYFYNMPYMYTYIRGANITFIDCQRNNVVCDQWPWPVAQ